MHSFVAAMIAAGFGLTVYAVRLGMS
jgi:hypothetical protein